MSSKALTEQQGSDWEEVLLQALFDFEEVIAMEKKQPSTPREYALVSSLFRVSHYNVACCYAAIDQVQIMFSFHLPPLVYCNLCSKAQIETVCCLTLPLKKACMSDDCFMDWVLPLRSLDVQLQ